MGIFRNIQNFNNLNEVMNNCGLNFTVSKKPLYYREGDNTLKVPGRFGLFKEDDNRFIEVVSDKYQVIQNDEAFSPISTFTDKLNFVGGGHTNNYKKIWIQTKFKDGRKVFGDNFDMYMFIIHSFDRTVSLLLSLTPVRVVCQNAIITAISKAKRIISVRHIPNYEEKIKEFEKHINEFYNYPLEESIKPLIEVPMNTDKANKILKVLFNVEEEAVKENELKRKNNKIEKIDTIISIYKNKDDLQNISNNGYRLYNAISDYVSNEVPKSRSVITDNYKMKMITGHPLLKKAELLIKEAA